MLLLAVHDAVQGFTLENIVDSSFSNIYKVNFTAYPCFLAYDLFKNNIENLLLLAKSIPSICLLAIAQGNEMELYAFRQEVSRAYAFWQVLRAMRWNFMPLGKKYPEHTPFGEGSGQEPRLCFRFVKYLPVPLLTQCPRRRRGCPGCGGRSG